MLYPLSPSLSLGIALLPYLAGHGDCDKYEEPGPPDPDVKLPPTYGWERFPHQNELARDIMYDTGGIFVNVSAISKNRHDSHLGKGDCLHHCIPGPIDTWVQILFNVFKQMLHGV